MVGALPERESMESILDLQMLSPVDWRVLKEVRLRALQDSPHAFMSCYDTELRLSDLEWRRMFDASTWIVARQADAVVALGRSVLDLGRPRARHVESIWVAPTHRRRGVFRSLLYAIAEIESRNGVTDLLLWVLDDNHDAQRVYETLGFQPTGERQFLPDLGRFERQFKLGIRHLPGLAS
jgi:ribosomal protein S18 acetylase RimI-like enzyme